MERQPYCSGFPPLPDADELLSRILTDPLQVRWRVVRQLFHIRRAADRHRLMTRLHPYLHTTVNRLIRERIALALQVLQHPSQPSSYILIRGEGVRRMSRAGDAACHAARRRGYDGFFPVIDFHVHPRVSDLKLLTDMDAAGVTHAVLLATDTDANDADQPETERMLRRVYTCSGCSAHLTFEVFKNLIKAALTSCTRISNQDVADWVADYPNHLIGLGSVNPSRDRACVTGELQRLADLGMRGINLLPQQQFFNPSENNNMHLLLEFCREQQMFIMSHSGCGQGPFEMLEFCRNAHPANWEPCLKKYPDVVVILAHMGAYTVRMPGIWLHEALQLGKKYRNVYADLSSVGWMLNNQGVVAEIRKTIGFDRVLLASGYPEPLNRGMSMASVVGGIKASLHLTAKERRKVLGLNAARLLGL